MVSTKTLQLAMLPLLILAVSIHCSLQMEVNCTGIDNLLVEYRLEFPQENCSGGNNSLIPRPNPLTIDLPCGQNLQTLMELAADSDPSYEFTLSYVSRIGFEIEAINGTERNDLCDWYLFYQAPGEEEPAYLRNVELITTYVIPDDNSTVVLQYQTEPPPPPIPSPSPVPTSTPFPSATPGAGGDDDDGALPLVAELKLLVLLLCLGACFFLAA